MSILDRKFKYRPSYDTDVGRRVRAFKRKAAAQLKAAKRAAQPATPSKVAAIAGRKR